jgi:N-acetylmuramoyl-L-alanine amidase
MKITSKFFILLSAIVSFAFIKPDKSVPRQINVVIDAGHGGNDFGATSNSIMEKEIVKQIANKINTLNSNENTIIHLTRNSDDFITLSDRTTIINRIKPDLVLSLHVNTSKNSNTSGMEFYVSKESNSYEKSNVIAENFKTKFLNSNYKVAEIKNGNFFILKNSEAPAVIMELGYLTNESDKKNLANNNTQIQIAKKIIECLSELK